MLKNFNALIKNIILQQVTEDKDQKYIKLIYHCNEFYNRYLADLAIDSEVGITKQRNNTFLVVGMIKNLIKFFDNLKVDDMFMENPKDFTICAPQWTYNDQDRKHLMQRGQAYAPTTKDGVVTTHDVDNVVRETVYGKWYDFYQNQKKGQKLLKLQPSKFKKYIKDVIKKFNFAEDETIYIQFSVNCEQWKNNIFEDMAQYRTEDQINQIMADQKRNIDDDFDYSQAVMPKQKNEDHKKVLKGIKKTQKSFKENKVK